MSAPTTMLGAAVVAPRVQFRHVCVLDPLTSLTQRRSDRLRLQQASISRIPALNVNQSVDSALLWV